MINFTSSAGIVYLRIHFNNLTLASLSIYIFSSAHTVFKSNTIINMLYMIALDISKLKYTIFLSSIVGL